MLRKRSLLLIYLSLLLSIVQCQVEEVVEEDEEDKRIIGGTQVESAAQYPFIVAILERRGVHTMSKICTGTIIDQDTILTAAHCCETSKSNNRDLFIVGGATDAFDLHNCELRKVQECIQHPKYAYNHQWSTREALAYDVAIIKLTKPLIYSKTITPISIAPITAKLLPSGISIGYGVTGNPPRENENTKLHFAETPILSETECQSLWGPMKGVFCAGTKDRTACVGDSGGPLIYLENNGPVQKGVISRGSNPCKTSAVYIDLSRECISKFIKNPKEAISDEEC